MITRNLLSLINKWKKQLEISGYNTKNIVKQEMELTINEYNGYFYGEEYKSIYERYARQVNNNTAPGLPMNKVLLFVDDTLYTENEGVYIGGKMADYVNEILAWAFYKGIHCTGVNHGSFCYDRNYEELEKVQDKLDKDYDFDTEMLNFANCCMVAAYNHHQGKGKKITLLEWVGDAQQMIVREYDSEQDFEIGIKPDLEFLENYEEGENN